MPRFVAVSRARHGGKKWLASTAMALPLDTTWPRSSALSWDSGGPLIPCAFLQHAGRYTLMSVLSLIPGRNMFVGPDGRWLGRYVPACFQLYPFRMLAPEGTDQPVLCVDEDSGLVVEGSGKGEEFFDAEGNLSPAVKPTFEALVLAERSRRDTELAVAALAQAGVMRPWQFKVRTDQGEKATSGLHRIDETALRALPDDVFLQLRATSALPIAYAHMLSAGQLGVFEQLARLHHRPAPSPLASLPRIA